MSASLWSLRSAPARADAKLRLRSRSRPESTRQPCSRLEATRPRATKTSRAEGARRNAPRCGARSTGSGVVAGTDPAGRRRARKWADRKPAWPGRSGAGRRRVVRNSRRGPSRCQRSSANRGTPSSTDSPPARDRRERPVRHRGEPRRLEHARRHGDERAARAGQVRRARAWQCSLRSHGHGLRRRGTGKGAARAPTGVPGRAAERWRALPGTSPVTLARPPRRASYIAGGGFRRTTRGTCFGRGPAQHVEEPPRGPVTAAPTRPGLASRRRLPRAASSHGAPVLTAAPPPRNRPPRGC